MSTILVQNERPGVLDLSGVQDVNGLPVVLQPKGTDGETRECSSDVVDHPHMVNVLSAGWVSLRPAAAAPEKGPTLEVYVKAGYKPENYPPHGFAEVPSPGLTAYRTQRKAVTPPAPPKPPPVPTPKPESALVTTRHDGEPQEVTLTPTPRPEPLPEPKPAPKTEPKSTSKSKSTKGKGRSKNKSD